VRRWTSVDTEQSSADGGNQQSAQHDHRARIPVEQKGNHVHNSPQSPGLSLQVLHDVHVQ
jgi:hypothetical protein